jgi:hypothetical protein
VGAQLHTEYAAPCNYAFPQAKLLCLITKRSPADRWREKIPNGSLYTAGLQDSRRLKNLRDLNIHHVRSSAFTSKSNSHFNSKLKFRSNSKSKSHSKKLRLNRPLPGRGWVGFDSMRKRDFDGVGDEGLSATAGKLY